MTARAGGSDGRVTGDVTDIDYDHTHHFFRARAARTAEAVAQTTFQDHDPGLGVRRDRHEEATILPLLDLVPGRRVLDIGCGSGRWAAKLAPHDVRYHGIDFTDEFVRQARETAAPGHTFQTLAAPDATPEQLDVEPPFGTILVVGVLMYLNDGDAEAVIARLPSLAAAAAVLYLTEPVGLAERLTLVDVWSDELQATYSAVYRERSDYEAMFTRHLEPAGFTVDHTDALYPPELRNREETRQEVWVLRR